MNRIAGVLVSFVVLEAARVLAQQPLGGEFGVNSSPSAVQGQVAVGANTSGAFVVAWTRGAFPNEDVFARRFDANGAPLGSEFRVNTTTTNAQDGPAVAMDASGNFMVVWQGLNDGVKFRIYGQRYASSGAPLGGEFRVDGTNTYAGYSPRVACDSSGNFIVAWGQTSGNSVEVQRFNSSGTPLGEFSAGNGSNPDLAPLRSGAYVVTFMNPSTPPYHVQGRRYDANGTGLGAEFRVDGGAGFSAQITPRVAATAAGDFQIAYAGNGTTTSVYARRYAPSGAPLAAEARIDLDGVVPAAVIASTAADPTGFLVTWSTPRGNGTSDVRARHLPGGEFRVNTTLGYYQGRPDVAGLAPGSYVVAWPSSAAGQSLGIFAQRYAFRLSGDVNADGNVNVADVFYLINYLFAGGAAPVVERAPADDAEF
jgi:hypothetical protein